MFMEKILISACLVGDPVRYDGRSVLFSHPLIDQWKVQGRLIKCCPECAGGLPTPRLPAEICSGGGRDVIKGRARVLTKGKEDITQFFLAGAQAALIQARANGISIALLKEKSPSCGVNEVYDGNFNRNLIKGMGVTAALLRKNGVKVFSENEIDDVKSLINHNF